MGLRDRLRELTSRAEKTAAEHGDEIRQTIGKAEAVVDQQTGGKYHDKIAKADAKAEAYLEGLEAKQAQPAEGAGPDAAEAPSAGRPSEPQQGQ